MQIWQILNDRFDKIYKAPFPAQAFQVTLMQVCYIGQLPPLRDILMENAKPEEKPEGKVIEKPLMRDASEGMLDSSCSSAQGLSSVEAFLDVLRDKREPILYAQVCRDIAFQSFNHGHVAFYTKPGAPANIQQQIKLFLEKQTGQSWTVENLGVSKDALSIQEKNDENNRAQQAQALKHPLVQDILASFPGATAKVEGAL